LVSGDVSEGQEGISDFFEINEPVCFSQSPEDKLLFIQKLQKKGNKVLMLGDGLNDAGALKQSEVGIALTEDSTAFTPASDAILEASAFQQLPQMLKFCRNTLQTIYFSFGLSLAYNITGLYFAIQGNMSPLFAAVLMPISSITIIAFTTGMTRWHAGRGGLR
jgi:Cu+-exporting ATPase